MNLLLFFLGSCVAMALWAQRRDELPRMRPVLLLIVIVSAGFLTRRLI
jgi:uncharacterized membrane protein YhhN